MRVYLPKNRKARRKLLIRIAILLTVLLAIVVLICVSCSRIFHKKSENNSFKFPEKNPITRPELDIQLLTANEYSRPGMSLDHIKGIVIHYTANPGTTAIENRNYFEGLKDSHITKASSHFIIGLDGEIVQCIPTNEIAYASNKRNSDTVAIECCHPKADGKFNDKTYDSLVELTAWLCCEFHVDPDDVIRHYDVTGKICPKYFVEHEDKWEDFKEDVEQYINNAM